MVWYFHLFKSFPQFIMIHTVKAFGTWVTHPVSGSAPVPSVKHHPALCDRMLSPPFCIWPTCRYSFPLVQNQSPEGAQRSFNSYSTLSLLLIWLSCCLVLLATSSYIFFSPQTSSDDQKKGLERCYISPFMAMTSSTVPSHQRCLRNSFICATQI